MVVCNFFKNIISQETREEAFMKFIYIYKYTDIDIHSFANYTVTDIVFVNSGRNILKSGRQLHVCDNCLNKQQWNCKASDC